MNLTRVRATIVAGMLASSMVLPGMTVMAKNSDGSTEGSPQIKKIVTVADGVTSIPTADSTVTFSVNQLDNASGIVAPNAQQYFSNQSVTIDVANVTGTSTEFAEEILSGAGISLSDVGEYTFEIREDTTSLNIAGTQSSFGWSVVDGDSVYYLRVLIKNNGDGTTSTLYFLTNTNNDPATYGGSTSHKLDSADFVNTYNKKSTEDGDPDSDPNTLTVTKDVLNPEYVSSSNEYDIKVTVQLPATQKGADGNYFVADGDYTASISGQVDGCGEKAPTGTLDAATGQIVYSVKLHDGESIVISDMAEGVTYSVVEENTDQYTNLTSIGYKVDGATSAAENCADQTFDGNDSTVIVENTFKDVTATGVVTSVAPYITLVAVAAAGIAGYMVLKRRVAR